MPSYHFEVKGPADEGDPRVLEFSGLAEAKREALKLAGTLIADTSETFWDVFPVSTYGPDLRL